MIAQKTHIIDLFPGTFSASGFGKISGILFRKKQSYCILRQTFWSSFGT